MSVKEKVLEFIKAAGPKGAQNSAIAAHIGGRLDAPKQHLEELIHSGDIFKRNDMIYWSFVHKDFK